MQEQTHDTIKNVDEQGNSVKRVSSAIQAHGIFRRLLKHNENTAKTRAKIQGLIDGNAPYSDTKLKRMGQAWRSNVNYREAEAEIEKNVNMYWQLIMEVPSLIDVKIKPAVIKKNNLKETDDFEEIIAEEFSEILREWPGFFYNATLHSSEMIKYGLGPIMFPDEDDWKFEAIKNASCMIPAKTKSTSCKNQFVCIRDEMTLTEIFTIIGDKETEEAADDRGWRPRVLKETVINALNKKEATSQSPAGGHKYQLSDWEDIQQSWKNGLLEYVEDDFDGLRVVHEFIMEASGKVSHVIIREDNCPASANDFIYDVFEEYKNMDEAVHLFFYSIGDGYFKSIKGLGHKIYALMELSNRFTNTAMDGGMMAASLILKPGSGEGKNKARLTRVGPITMLPKNFDAIQQSFAPNFQHLLAMKGVLKQIQNNNVGNFDPRGASPEQVEKTLGQVQIEAASESRFTRNQTALYYVQWGRLLKEIYRRLTKSDYNEKAPGYDEHKEFRNNCITRGVPAFLLDCKNLKIKPVKAIGQGSAAMEQMIMDKLFSQRGAFDERGRRNATRDWLTGLVGYSNVDRYAPRFNRNIVPDSEASIATLENNDFAQGQNVPVGFDQEHNIHIMVHMKPMIDIAKAYEQQPQAIDPRRALPVFKLGIPHTTTHLQYFAQDPSRKNEVEQYQNALQDLTSIMTKMEKALQKQQEAAIQQAQQEAQANNNQLSEDTLVKLKKIEADAQLALLKEQNLNAIRELKAAHSMQIKSAIAANTVQTQNQKEE